MDAILLSLEGESRALPVIRSRRRTLSLEAKNGQVLIRAPLRMSEATIRTFLETRKDWILTQLHAQERQRAQAEAQGVLSAEELSALMERAKRVFPDRVAFYAAKMGLRFGRISIRCQRTRWGSCSAKGNLSFNCLLLLAPEGVLDSVVVHELCHLDHMDHSRAFYKEVLRYFPDYWEKTAWLKQNGGALLLRVPPRNHQGKEGLC